MEQKDYIINNKEIKELKDEIRRLNREVYNLKTQLRDLIYDIKKVK